MTRRHTTTVVVGVVHGQPSVVAAEAAVFAQRFGAHLVCATVDTARYPVDTREDGSVLAAAIDPDVVDDVVEVFDPGLLASLAAVLDPLPVTWSVRALAGGAARELARLADELDAAMIVVGTREAGLKGSLRELVNGSVAAQLAHRQHRPVVVVPLNPGGAA